MTDTDDQKKPKEIEQEIKFIPKGINPKLARQIIIITDGNKWELSPLTNSSVLEIRQICQELLNRYK
jgi:hypothetical protein